MVDKNTTNLIMALLSLLALLLFVALYGIALVRTFQAVDVAPVFDEPFLYIATTLAGLVGGLVATSLGQKPDPNNPLPPNTLRPDGSPAPSLLMLRVERAADKMNLSAISKTVDTRRWLGIAYMIIYILIGFAALFTWLFRSQLTPDLIRNLALIFLGLMLAVARTFFGQEPS